MEEIKVGHFGRTNKGKIFKFAWVKDESYVYLFDNKHFEKYYLTDGEKIIKESENITDLLEVGDIATMKYRHLDVIKPLNETDITDLKSGELKLVSVVTHEQFNSIKYEVI